MDWEFSYEITVGRCEGKERHESSLPVITPASTPCTGQKKERKG